MPFHSCTEAELKALRALALSSQVLQCSFCLLLEEDSHLPPPLFSTLSLSCVAEATSLSSGHSFYCLHHHLHPTASWPSVHARTPFTAFLAFKHFLSPSNLLLLVSCCWLQIHRTQSDRHIGKLSSKVVLILNLTCETRFADMWRSLQKKLPAELCPPRKARMFFWYSVTQLHF